MTYAKVNAILECPLFCRFLCCKSLVAHYDDDDFRTTLTALEDRG